MNTKSIKIAKEIKDSIIRPIPEYLIKQREGGGKKMLSYISGSTVTDMLNSAFGYMWSWKVTSEWIQESQPAVNKYVNGQFSKDSSKWTLEPQGPVAHVKGLLTVYMSTENGTIIEIHKEGYGSKSVLGKQNDQESIFKAAGTDALKKAASLLGIGLELYRDDDEQYYFDELNYENPWTDEMQVKYADQLSNLSKYTETYGVTDEEISEIVLAATGSENEIYPHNIEAVMNYIEKSLEAQ